ncbi:hypothetical protein [Paenisporosarcina indica]|uniref:hypothetical protein n=1 Tax=Paenisporosarcina indica TaxID=650093 RepID=UPI0009500BB4|nr:hypothetical protein [Paenisporosarcina indica]
MNGKAGALAVGGRNFIFDRLLNKECHQFSRRQNQNQYSHGRNKGATDAQLPEDVLKKRWCEVTKSQRTTSFGVLDHVQQSDVIVT